MGGEGGGGEGGRKGGKKRRKGVEKARDADMGEVVCLLRILMVGVGAACFGHA